MQTDLEEWRTRLRKRLAVVVDYGWPYQVRIAAIKSVQSMMPLDHYLRAESPDALLSRVLRPFARREVIIDRRAVMLQVRRPPVSLVDVWEV
jgi:hypothetical protein